MYYAKIKEKRAYNYERTANRHSNFQRYNRRQLLLCRLNTIYTKAC